MRKKSKPVGYCLYVDEAGDDGISAVKPIDPDGASEWLVISGVLVRAANMTKPPEWVRDFRKTIKGAQRPDLHFYSLSDEKRREACAYVATLPIRWISVVSNKRNLRGYTNPRAAKKDTRSPWYNWMLRLLLERCTAYCAARTMKDYGEFRTMRIELAARGGLSKARIKAYLYYLRNQSRGSNLYITRGDLVWDMVDLDQVEVFQARSRAGIQLADTVASAFKQSVELLPDGTCRDDYMPSLWRVVTPDRRGTVADFGVKLMPSPPALWRAGLADAQIEFFVRCGYARDYMVSPGSRFADRF
jgi:hypothetical protein